MNFENDAIEFLNTLCINGTFISGDIIGVNEVLKTAQSKVMVEINSEISERLIIIYKLDSVLTWKYLYTIKNKEEDFKYLSETDWKYPEFVLRIVTPISLILQYPQFEVWFRINNLPVVNLSGTLHCYCNVILPEHQYLIDSLEGVVTIENRLQ